jgi:hypothetical protein
MTQYGRETGARVTPLIVGAACSAVAAIVAVTIGGFTQLESHDSSALTRNLNLHEYTESDDLIQPSDSHE